MVTDAYGKKIAKDGFDLLNHINILFRWLTAKDTHIISEKKSSIDKPVKGTAYCAAKADRYPERLDIGSYRKIVFANLFRTNNFISNGGKTAFHSPEREQVQVRRRDTPIQQASPVTQSSQNQADFIIKTPNRGIDEKHPPPRITL